MVCRGGKAVLINYYYDSNGEERSEVSTEATNSNHFPWTNATVVIMPKKPKSQKVLNRKS
jgi:hypothetical protein